MSQRYTHIPIINWIDESYKEYGTIVIVGRISLAQAEQIMSYLRDGQWFVPARLAEAHDLEMNNLHGTLNEMLPPDRWEVKLYPEADGEPWDEGPFDLGQFIAALRIASERGMKTAVEKRAEKVTKRKKREKAIVGDARRVRELYKEYADFDGDSDTNEELRWRFIEEALKLVDVIIGDGEQT